MKGRTALVTAASRGFGLATAKRLAAEGCQVALCARGEEDLARAADAVREAGEEAWGGSGGRVMSRALDVRDDAAVAAWIDAIAARFGPVDLLLVNAGGPPAGGFGDLDLAAWDAAYRLTIESAVRLCRLVLPGMKARGFGRIVAVTSIAARQPVDNLVLSNALRPAVHGLVKCLADDAAARGVTVNAVAPGFHATSAVDRLIAARSARTGETREEVVAGWTRAIPAGRLGEADELAALITFLMSVPAGYITGQCVTADGGWTRATP
ncbi:MAG TPA: SDR family oxidoreductase [Candidatus Krumholzibacteria bacterium]|nr:SDR family oxidoreductase [Candidatus Krumholzibacteria bacterium]